MTEPFIIPSLETERLLLRAFRQEDLDPFAEMVANVDVMHQATYDGDTMSKSQAWNWLCMMLGHWHMRGFGIWGVEEKISGDLIGRIGLQFLDWFDNVEMVWMLKQSAWGQGYATEGVRAAISYGMETLALPRLSAVIRVENKPSIRLAQRLGMHCEREVERQEIKFYDYIYTIEQYQEKINR